MTPVELILDRLAARDLKSVHQGGGYQAQCPHHEDRSPSLGITEGADGQCLLVCRAGCRTEDVLADLGLSLADLFPTGNDRAERRSERTPKQAGGALRATNADVALWHEALLQNPAAIERLGELRGWTREQVVHYKLGLKADEPGGSRITIPTWDAAGRLVAVARYQPNPEKRDGANPKMRAIPGSQRKGAPFPAVETLSGAVTYVVEGEPDVIAAHVLGVEAVGFGGANKRNGWVVPLAAALANTGKPVVLVPDCDEPGREAMDALALALVENGCDVRILDLSPLNAEAKVGFDLGDALIAATRDGRAGIAALKERIHLERAQPFQAPEAERDGPVPDLGGLLERVSEFIRHYVSLPSEHETAALALWVMHTWTIDAAYVTPYLTVLSPEKQSGKTRLIEVLALVAARAWSVSALSSAALFRKIAQDNPTVFLDEIDAMFGSQSETAEALRGIINAGNRRGASVSRCVGEGSKQRVEDFGVFGAKLMAGIDHGRIPDTITDRAIPIRMKRTARAERVERFRYLHAKALAEPLKEDLEAWATVAVHALASAEPDLPDDLRDRPAEAWEPLFAIADLADGEWPERARTAALVLNGGDSADESSTGTLLLAAIRKAFGPAEAMFTDDLLGVLNADDELPFGGWRDGKGLDSRGLARILKRYDVKPRTVRVGDDTRKGYHRSSGLDEAWTRYLAPLPSQGASHQSQASHGAGGGRTPGEQRSNGAVTTPLPSRETPRHSGDVTDVTDVPLPDEGGGWQAVTPEDEACAMRLLGVTPDPPRAAGADKDDIDDWDSLPPDEQTRIERIKREHAA